MPRYPYNNLANHFWPEQPPAWPWRSKDDRDLVWNRDLPKKLLQDIQEIRLPLRQVDQAPRRLWAGSQVARCCVVVVGPAAEPVGWHHDYLAAGISAGKTT